MPYTPKVWKNAPDTTTPIDKDSLNNIESGIAGATATAESHASRHAPGGADDLSGIYAPIDGSRTPTGKAVLPANLAKYRKALAALRAGTSDVKVLCAGDSTVSGFGSGTPAYQGGWPARLAGLLNGKIAPAAPGLGLLPLAPDSDPRWTLGTGWTQFTAYSFGNSGCAYAASAPAGNLVYADSRITADRFDVYYANLPGNGQLTVTATGGAPVVVTPSGAGGVAKLTASAAAAGTGNSLTIACAGVAEILFIEPYLSTTKTIRVSNAGRNGTTTNEWINNSVNISTLACIDAYAPDLTFLCLGINDATSSRSLATYTANMNTIIARLQQTGDVIPVVPHSTGNAAGVEALLATYRAAIPSIAAGKGCMWVDEAGRFGTYSGGNPFYYDIQHLNGPGHWDMAQMVYAALTSF